MSDAAASGQARLSRLALGLEYHGGHFLGWQIQAQEPTVQGEVESALSRVADNPIRVHAAGRTDAGVHALNQVIHFDPPVHRPLHAWLLGLNRYLPDHVSALWIRPVSQDFHARFSALARIYEFRILNRTVRPAVAAGQVSWIRRSLDAAAMHQAAQHLAGEHDFSSFRASGCQANHPVRDIHAIRVQRRGDTVSIRVTANAFLYHMVRNIAGVLIQIGLDEADTDWTKQLLAHCDRTAAAATAAPGGLYFLGPRYPGGYNVPFLEGDKVTIAEPAIPDEA